MSGETEEGRAPLNHTRDVTIDALMEHFANDVMDIEEFERRVDIAHSARTSGELKALLQDLPGSANLPAVPGGGAATTPAPSPGYSVTSAAHVQDQQFVVACLGGSTRRGRWSPARTNYAISIMGGAELDFREATLGPGVTEVKVFALWGGVEIIVPPGLNVESHGIALMGGFDHHADATLSADPSAPTVRITGISLMAGVDVSVRYAGETARDAKRRRKLERREQRRRLRGG